MIIAVPYGDARHRLPAPCDRPTAPPMRVRTAAASTTPTARRLTGAAPDSIAHRRSASARRHAGDLDRGAEALCARRRNPLSRESISSRQCMRASASPCVPAAASASIDHPPSRCRRGRGQNWRRGVGSSHGRIQLPQHFGRLKNCWAATFAKIRSAHFWGLSRHQAFKVCALPDMSGRWHPSSHHDDKPTKERRRHRAAFGPN